jgi:acetyltransferase-like isoleucine patch superfamily enzyme
MAHSAEEVTTEVLHEAFDIKEGEYFFSDIRNGFVIKFHQKPDIDLEKLAVLIDEKIAQNLSISYYDEDHILLGDKIVSCDGSRFHVNNTSEIKNFSLVKRLVYDSATNTHCLIGVVDNHTEDLENRNTRYFLTRKSLE